MIIYCVYNRLTARAVIYFAVNITWFDALLEFQLSFKTPLSDSICADIKYTFLR